MFFEYNRVPNSKVVRTNLKLTLALNLATIWRGPLEMVDDRIPL